MELPIGQLTSALNRELDLLVSSPLAPLSRALVSLPVATLLGAALAFRPRRKGTPLRVAAVAQTQIILAIVGALVMLVIGDSVARAFGIVGAAGLVRYRAKISDPKDAGVMLSTLGIGLAAGVGAYALAVFATLFILAMLWIIESRAQPPQRVVSLRISTPAPGDMCLRIEDVLQRFGIKGQMLRCSSDALIYELEMPAGVKAGEIANAIFHLDGTKRISVEYGKPKVALR